MRLLKNMEVITKELIQSKTENVFTKRQPQKH